MTGIKSVYKWKVVLINKSALDPNNTAMVVHTHIGEENTALACAEKITQLIAEECRKNSDYVVRYANFDYEGEEL